MRIPLWIEAERLKVLVLGGGSVGVRRAELFARAGAKVKIVALDVAREIPGVEVVRGDLRKLDLSPYLTWADLVVIAVNDVALAEELFKRAEAAGKLINDATDAGRTHVVVPYFRNLEGLKVAVTSEGVAGTPARLSLDVVEECIKRSWIPTFFKAYAAAKAAAKRTIKNAKRRMSFYEELMNDAEFMELVKRGEAEEATRRAYEIIKRYME